MKKILFLSFAYPYGHFGPSDNCTARIMGALVQNGNFEVHNISCRPSKTGVEPNYAINDRIKIHYLSFPEKNRKRSNAFIHFMMVLKIPIYPLTSIWMIWKYYRACKRIVSEEQYDVVVSQCNPDWCVITAAFLRKRGFINNHMVVFWDNIYGRLPRRFIPRWFALSRQRKLENWVARYTDKIVSLYPIKQFHEELGDVETAREKRVYLGIPSIAPPKKIGLPPKIEVIKSGMINILYSGSIFRREYVSYLVELINQTQYAEKINLIFFSKGVPKDDFLQLQKKFNGNIFSSGWIPIDDLLALYPMIDVFVSFPGVPTAIRSKVFEYMSYGKPIVLLYDDDDDVNVSTFSRYPYCLSIDERIPSDRNVDVMNNYLTQCLGKSVDFDEVEKLFPYDTTSAYVKLIEDIC